MVARDVTAREEDLLPIGVSGLAVYGGYVHEEKLPELSGQAGRDIYREMSDNDATVSAILFAITMLVRGVTWQVVPAKFGEWARNRAGFERVMHVVMPMKKLDLAKLQAAYDGK